MCHLTRALSRPSHWETKKADIAPADGDKDTKEEGVTVSENEDTPSEDELWENTNRR